MVVAVLRPPRVFVRLVAPQEVELGRSLRDRPLDGVGSQHGPGAEAGQFRLEAAEV